MISTGSLIAFTLTCLIIEATPGPNMGYLAILSASKGRPAGFAATAGVALGLLLIGLASAFGLAVLISNSTLLHQTLRWGGIFYLLWLAWDGWQEGKETSPEKTSNPTLHIKYFRRGLIVNLLNPKAAVFYIAILPTFINAQHSVLAQTLILTFTYVFLATLIHITIVMLAGSAQEFLSSPKRNIAARRMFSLLLVGIAIWFGLSTKI